MTDNPILPTPPDIRAAERRRCSICQNKVRKPIIDAALDKGLSNAIIARDMTETGWPLGPLIVARHRRHYFATTPARVVDGIVVPARIREKDLAIIVRDRTLEAIEDGRLDIESDNWSNVGPGLRAQGQIESRTTNKNDRKALLAIGIMLLGGGRPVPEEALGIEDGLTIEGEFTEGADEAPE